MAKVLDHVHLLVHHSGALLASREELVEELESRPNAGPCRDKDNGFSVWRSALTIRERSGKSSAL